MQGGDNGNNVNSDSTKLAAHIESQIPETLDSFTNTEFYKSRYGMFDRDFPSKCGTEFDYRGPKA